MIKAETLRNRAVCKISENEDFRKITDKMSDVASDGMFFTAIYVADDYPELIFSNILIGLSLCGYSVKKISECMREYAKKEELLMLGEGEHGSSYCVSLFKADDK